jgi:protein involved in polysaccharide export with SLBB domain
MTWKTFVSILSLGLLASFWTGCETTGGKQRDVICTDDTIRNGDTLIISLLDIPAPMMDKEFVVGNDGTVNLPEIGSIKAAGKKFTEFESEARDAYLQKQIYKRITVVAKPGLRFYSVSGEVRQAGRQSYYGQTTVLRAIASAGGFNEFANRRRVEIIRADGNRDVVNCVKALKNPALDLPICPGDYISVPRSL